MKKIDSFKIDHTRLKRGIYISRRDEVGGTAITTFDLRIKMPNYEESISPAVSHTIEHIGATFLRNHQEFGNRVLYFGPMGCLTGFYLILTGDISSLNIIKLIQATFKHVACYTGAIPGASPSECGNHLLMDLIQARNEADKYLSEVLEMIKNDNLEYPEADGSSQKSLNNRSELKYDNEKLKIKDSAVHINTEIVCFDADDTLWVNEPYFQEAEQTFCNMLELIIPAVELKKELFKTEMANLELYGYGIKSFILSMIETANRVGEGKLPWSVNEDIIQLGHELLNKPVILLEGVEELLEYLHGCGKKLIVATKGDLLDQKRKLAKSNIERFFHHVEIMSDKKESDYRKLLIRLGIAPNDFVMIGNSVKSDILPVLGIGGYGIHIPFATTWLHEVVETFEKSPRFYELDQIIKVKELLK